ncbi:CvpA family protein [Candidatus Curtissbacteria bacterium]|nr:CvpA family protein [Candidatus Curtissbacteria bacterium]
MLNWVDLLILVAVLFSALQSQRVGLINEILNFAGLTFSLIGSLLLYPGAAFLITKVFTLPKIVINPIAFLVVWIVIETGFFLLVKTFGGKLFGKITSRPADAYLGFIPGVLNGLLFSAFTLLFVVSLPINPSVKQDIFNSKFGSSLVSAASKIEEPFNNIFGPIAKQSLTFLTVNPEEKGSVELGYTQQEFTIDLAGEQQIFNLVNQERAKVGAAALVWNESRAQVGRGHSEDMFKRGYFSHYSPEGKDVGDRLQEASISYSIAGENLALAPSIQRAHDGLMNSPGHRRNILDPAFKRVGIGVIDGGVYGKMVTQIFTD